MRALITSLIFVITITTNLPAQQAAWMANLPGNIIWQRVTSYGSLIVATNNGLAGVDVESGNINWVNNDLSGISESDYHPIEGGPFVEVIKDGGIYILEPIEGKVVFNSQAAAIYKIQQSHILPANQSILIHGFTGSSPSPGLFMFDLASGNLLWNNFDDLSMLTAFLELGGDDFVIATLWEIYKINSRNGNVEWQQPIDDATAKQLAKLKGLGEALKKMVESKIQPGDVIAKFYALDSKKFLLGFQIRKTSEKTDSQGQKTVDISFESGYKCLDIKTGSSYWPEPVIFDGYMGTLIFGDKGMIVCPDAGSRTMLNYVDFATGVPSWGKKGRGIKLKGTVADFLSTDAGIMLLCEAGGSDSDPDYELNLLDPVAGLLLFDKNVKVKGKIERTEVIGDKLFYSTNKEAGVIEIATGTEITKKAIKTAPGLTLSAREDIYVFCVKDDNLYAISKADGTERILSTTEVKFKGSDTPNSLDIREKGVSISGMQNVALVSFEGTVEFNNYYEAPRLPGLIRALNAAAAVRAYYIGAVSKVAAGAWGAAAHDPENPLGPQLSMGVSNAYNRLGNEGFSYANKYMEAVKKRFSATAESAAFVFMVTTTDDKSNHLVRVSKDTGAIIDYIDLGKEKEPQYEVDNIYKRVYKQSGVSSVECYAF